MKAISLSGWTYRKISPRIVQGDQGTELQLYYQGTDLDLTFASVNLFTYDTIKMPQTLGPSIDWGVTTYKNANSIYTVFSQRGSHVLYVTGPGLPAFQIPGDHRTNSTLYGCQNGASVYIAYTAGTNLTVLCYNTDKDSWNTFCSVSSESLPSGPRGETLTYPLIQIIQEDNHEKLLIMCRPSDGASYVAWVYDLCSPQFSNPGITITKIEGSLGYFSLQEGKNLIARFDGTNIYICWATIEELLGGVELNHVTYSGKALIFSASGPATFVGMGHDLLIVYPKSDGGEIVGQKFPISYLK